MICPLMSPPRLEGITELPLAFQCCKAQKFSKRTTNYVAQVMSSATVWYFRSYKGRLPIPMTFFFANIHKN